jgi:hypothetical protein
MKIEADSMKKLLTLFSLLLMLAAMIAAPKTALAGGSCPLPGGSAYAYCADYACPGSPVGDCVSLCVESICQSGNLPQCC